MITKLILILSLISTSAFAQVDCDKYKDEYIPIDLNDALNYLDCKWSGSDKDTFRLRPENDAVAELHFGTGMGIRNSWELWKGDSEIAKFFRNLGIIHPDDMSSIILTSFHRYLNGSDIKMEEQISFYKSYWEKSKIAEGKRMKSEFKEYHENDTVEFNYSYEFVSKRQEKKWMDDLCIAKGIVLEKDTTELILKIKLIESCDKKGIIISKGDIYIKEGEKWILKEKNKIEIMKIGDTRWTNYNNWEAIE